MYGGLGALGALAAAGRKGAKGRRGKVIRGEEVYTDKDRAAAVQMGHRDIKQSLRMKRHQERVHALQLPEEADGSTLLALGQYELRQGNTDIAIAFVNKALQLCPEDKTALVARSKCYLLLGQPRLALQDAENALGPDRSNVRAIFQKAEALYHMGDFEHSLMYYHRGLRLRPELAVFRLGVQKAQEAIENTIGTGIEESCKIMEAMEQARSGRSGGKGSMKTHPVSPSTGRRSSAPSPKPRGHTPSPVPGLLPGSSPTPSPAPSPSPGPPSPTATLPAALPLAPNSARSRSSRSYTSTTSPPASSRDEEELSARRLLGELCVDKLYLEQLLKHPDIRCARKERSRTSQIAEHAEDGVEFLRKRQEFWRQQKLSSGPGGVPAGGGGSGGRRRGTERGVAVGGAGTSSTTSSARSSARGHAGRPQAVA
ncbi:zinc finger CCCH domain-containing protein 7B-like [Frankliniella occidentalis]|uniref:Outer dynein arm-docking complex subunit 4 n=1 Tax=Frankliniella occidentalis TaxID=133901 RepID=A0A9C6X8V8_FRAOC|nr:zinc finger CCCH domain-containing protein 7B-like [Frankliniella occidentalis]